MHFFAVKPPVIAQGVRARTKIRAKIRIRIGIGIEVQPDQNSFACSDQSIGNGSRFFRVSDVKLAGCVPSRMALTTSGARQAR